MVQFNNINDIENFLRELANAAKNKEDKEMISFFFNVGYPTLTEYLGELRIVLKKALEFGKFQEYRSEINELISVINSSLRLSN